jgi:hypothetical protein
VDLGIPVLVSRLVRPNNHPSGLPVCAEFANEAVLEDIYGQLGFESTRNRNATFFECETCLFHNEEKQPGLGPGILRNLPDANASDAASMLLRFGMYERVYEFPSIKDQRDNLGIRVYSAMEKTVHFLSGFLSEDKRAKYRNTEDPRQLLPGAELFAAHLAARLPILSLIGAERQLTKVAQALGDVETAYVKTELKVKWQKAHAVLGSISSGLVLTIVAVVWVCAGMKVPVRDHNSFLSLARLLRTAVHESQSGSIDTGREVADSMAAALGRKGRMMRYGTRALDNGSVYEVDLWADVGLSFPLGMYR